MEGLQRRRPSYLELTMAMPGFSCSSGSDVGDHGCHMRDLDMNQPACGREEEFPMGTIEDDDETTPRPKKLRLSMEQSRLLEESFRQNQTLDPKQKETLAFRLKLRQRQVEVWFQNRRARTKLKQTEKECEYMKRCFLSLTEENRILKREVAELRSMKAAPPTATSPKAASLTLLCPRCEWVTSGGESPGTWAPPCEPWCSLRVTPFGTGCP